MTKKNNRQKIYSLRGRQNSSHLMKCWTHISGCWGYQQHEKLFQRFLFYLLMWLGNTRVIVNYQQDCLSRDCFCIITFFHRTSHANELKPFITKIVIDRNFRFPLPFCICMHLQWNRQCANDWWLFKRGWRTYPMNVTNCFIINRARKYDKLTIFLPIMSN